MGFMLERDRRRGVPARALRAAVDFALGSPIAFIRIGLYADIFFVSVNDRIGHRRIGCVAGIRDLDTSQ